MSGLRHRRGGNHSEQCLTTTTASPETSKLRVVIVGGGPAGAVVAKALADRGLYDVHVLEAYPHPDEVPKNSGKAYVIALQPRGQRGIEEATSIVPLTVPGTVVSTEMIRHPSKKSLHHKDAPHLIAPRNTLTAHLLNEAKAAGATVSFHRKLVAVDFAKRVARLDSESSGTVVDVPYDLLIGADGANSTVRALLDQSELSDFAVERMEEDSMEFQVATIPSSFQEGYFPSQSAVHVWNDKKFNSLGFAFPLAGGKSMRSVVVFPQGKFDEWRKHYNEGNNGLGGFSEGLESLMPDVRKSVRDEMIQQFSEGTPHNGGLCIWVSALGCPNNGVVLVGDSGHAMWPSLGQGANCALESAAIFCKAVDSVASNIGTPVEWSASVVQQFNSERYHDARSCVDLTYGGVGARESRGRTTAPLTFKLQVGVMMLLHKLSFGCVPMPALLRLMKGEVVAYSTVHRLNFFYEKALCLSLLVACIILPLLWSMYQ